MDRSSFKSFDINAPSRVNPSANSRPVIVGHRPIMTDPMMRPAVASAATSPAPQSDDSPVVASAEPSMTTHVPKVIQVTEAVKEDLAMAQPASPPTQPEPTLAPAPTVDANALAAMPAPLAPTMPPDQAPSTPLTPATTEEIPGAHPGMPMPPSHDSPDGQAAVDQLPQVPEQDLSHIPHVPVTEHHRRSPAKAIALWSMIALFLAGFAAYLLIDAGVVGSSVKLPVHIFNQENIKPVSQTQTTPTPVAATPAAAPQAAADPTAGWIPYSSTKGKFAVKYPAGWVIPDSLALCETNSLLMLAPTKQSLGTCDAKTPGEMAIAYAKGDTRAQMDVSSVNYSSVTKEAVTVNGVAGFKETGTVTNAQAEGLPVGTKVVEYVFYTNGMTYGIGYSPQTGMPDVLNDFNTMVTKTLTFSA